MKSSAASETARSAPQPSPTPHGAGQETKVARDSGNLQQPPANVSRLLKLRVPVRVQLAHRRISVAAVRRLSLGAILEFTRSVDDPLTLLINNQRVGEGEAVKVGEHFGLRVKSIRTRAQRIEALRPAPERS